MGGSSPTVRMKILTLAIFYNGTAAIFMGTLSAVLMLILSALDLVWQPEINLGFGSIEFPTASVSGILVTTLVMILWRPSERIFLDKICVSQSSNNLKAQAILSLAGMLRRSDRMLILWDPTWTERLWCLFELAAFLKSKQDQDDKKKETLIIRPTLLGPICILLFFFFALLSLPLILAPHGDVRAMAICTSAVCSIAVGYLAVRATRGYFRSLQTMEQQLQSLSFDRAECHCCKQNHRYPSGRPMLCDKEVVKDCVNLWFGSQEAFEDFVRSKVSDIIIRKLNHAWGYRTALGVAAPVMWIFIDFAARYLVLEHKLLFLANMPFFRRLSFSYLMTGTCFWLMNVPSALQLASAVCKLGCRTGSTPCREIAKNLLVLSCIALWLSIIHVAPFILHNHSAFWLLHGKDVSLTAAIFPMLCSLIISRSRACMPI